MSSLEIARFAVAYIAVPIGMMYIFTTNKKSFQKILGTREYVVYPPEGPRPPSPEEMREMAREKARNRKDAVTHS